MMETINERHTPAENIAESSFPEPAAAMEYHIRLVEDIELLTDANGKIVSKGEAVCVCRGSASNLLRGSQ
jgi:hypothetical protein